jgi:Zn-dependent protease
MVELTVIQKIAVAILPLLFAITLHEAAHAWSAWKLGDDTAYKLGRVTLNPINHIDPLGTVILPVVLFALTGFAFGWAKPVPVNFGRLRKVRRDSALVSFAGPGANLLMLLIWAIIYKLTLVFGDSFIWIATPLGYMAVFGILINAILAALNLLPILPLDGGRILNAYLPYNLSQSFQKLEPYGLLIIMALLFTGILSPILSRMIAVINGFVFTLLGLN